MGKKNKNLSKYMAIGVLIIISPFIIRSFYNFVVLMLMSNYSLSTVESKLASTTPAFVKEYPPISVLDLRMRAKRGYVYINLMGVPKSDLIQLKHESFKSLRHINFGNLKIDDDVINDLSHLHVHSISIGYQNTAFSDDAIELFPKFPKLQELYIRNCNLTAEGIQKMSALKNLKKLKLVAPIMDDSLNAISNLKSLHSLSITVPAYPTAIDEANSQCFPKLTGRHLKGLCNLVKLEKLDLSGLPIDDSTFPELTCLSQLKKLSLLKTSITDVSLKKIVNFPQLTSLALNSTKTGMFNMNYLVQLRNLQKLSMRDTLLDDKNYEYIVRNSQLSTEDIYESGNGITWKTKKKLSHINKKTNTLFQR